MSKKSNKINQAITADITKEINEGITPESGVDSINKTEAVDPTTDSEANALNDVEDTVAEEAAVDEGSDAIETETEEATAVESTETNEDVSGEGENNENIETEDQADGIETVSEDNADSTESTEADEKVTIEETVDPVPEKAGKWYICVGNELSEAQQSTVQHRVESAKYDSITTPTGQVLVGPFDSREECIYARKMLIRKGVIGSIKLFN